VPKVRRRIDEKKREIYLSTLLIEEMKNHKLSVRQLAMRAKVSATTIQSIRAGEAENIGKGKEPQRDKADFPWFWGWDEQAPDWHGGRQFTGERYNDCHYSAAAKRNAISAIQWCLDMRPVLLYQLASKYNSKSVSIMRYSKCR
jgi:hypothetical protein